MASTARGDQPWTVVVTALKCRLKDVRSTRSADQARNSSHRIASRACNTRAMQSYHTATSCEVRCSCAACLRPGLVSINCLALADTGRTAFRVGCTLKCLLFAHSEQCRGNGACIETERLWAATTNERCKWDFERDPFEVLLWDSVGVADLGSARRRWCRQALASGGYPLDTLRESRTLVTGTGDRVEARPVSDVGLWHTRRAASVLTHIEGLVRE